MPPIFPPSLRAPTLGTLCLRMGLDEQELEFKRVDSSLNFLTFPITLANFGGSSARWFWMWQQPVAKNRWRK